MRVSEKGKKVNSFKIQTESFINGKLSCGPSYLFVQWQWDLSFLDSSLQMNITPVVPRWAVFHLWASRHVLHRCHGAHKPSVINPHALQGVPKPSASATSLTNGRVLCSKPVPQKPNERNSSGDQSATTTLYYINIYCCTVPRVNLNANYGLGIIVDSNSNNNNIHWLIQIYYSNGVLIAGEASCVGSGI